MSITAEQMEMCTKLSGDELIDYMVSQNKLHLEQQEMFSCIMNAMTSSDYTVFEAFHKNTIIEAQPNIDDETLIKKCKEDWESLTEEERHMYINGPIKNSREDPIALKLKHMAISAL